MLAELSIIPLRSGLHMSDELAEAVKLIDASGLPYQVTAAGTCIEGTWDEVIPLIRRCHDRVRDLSPHVVTIIKIEDEDGQDHKLTRNVTSVEEKIGRSLGRTRTLVTPNTPPAGS